jgi:N-acyl-L-homoserine lactone synthetase
MIIQNTLDIDGHKIYFGLVTTENEIQEVYRLRFDVYSARGYINKDKYSEKLESDEYDDGRSIYFIAKINEKTIGCIRVIRDSVLPTQKIFKFDTPKEFQNLNDSTPKDSCLCELGRFVIIPPDKNNGFYLPRGIVMMFMFKSMVEYAMEHNICGGYAFVKKSLENKMDKFNMPIHKIKYDSWFYPKDGVLFNYFNQQEDPVHPIYFMINEFKEYVEHVVHRKMMFDYNNEDNLFSLKTNLYTNFLKVMKII